MVARKTPNKKTAAKRQPKRISDAFIKEVTGRLASGQRVRRTLPDNGRLHIDRQLPFLCVHRLPDDRADVGTAELVLGEASYLIVSAERSLHKGVSSLVTAICNTMKEAFGSFLVVEIWSSAEDAAKPQNGSAGPTFQIVLSKREKLGMTVQAFEQALGDAGVETESTADVETVLANRPCPPGLASLIQPSVAANLGCHVMGIAIRPDYREPESGQLYPLRHRDLRRRLAAAYKRGFFDFTRRHTTHRPPHYHALGPRAMVKAVWAVDKQLAEVSNAFDFLLAVTPTNGDAVWSKFKRSRCEKLRSLIIVRCRWTHRC